MSMSDLDRLTQLVVGRAAGLRLFAQQWVDAATAEDLVQDSLISLLAEHRKPQNPIAWMYRAVRNAAFSHHRSSARRSRRERVAAEARGEWFETRTDVAIDARAAEAALQSLCSDDRQLVVMRIWGELTFAEIASIMDLSESTVHGRYKKALRELRSVLEKPCSSKAN
jgi:RNA polymerase sigma-70 factor (ECF subfamily)